MENPEKLATQDTQDEENINNSTTQHVLDTTTRKQIQTTQIRREPSYTQPEATMNRTSFPFRNSNKPTNTELRT
jgi:hypothetical protein